jgi:hypothetical protein
MEMRCARARPTIQLPLQGPGAATLTEGKERLVDISSEHQLQRRPTACYLSSQVRQGAITGSLPAMLELHISSSYNARAGNNMEETRFSQACLIRPDPPASSRSEH